MRSKLSLLITASIMPLLAACSSTGAGEGYENFEQRLIGDTLAGIGLISPQKEKIDYSPRAPLAMPPSEKRAQLPPPRTKQDLVANTAWPQDPDEARRQAALREAATPIDQLRDRQSGRRLTPEEMEQQANIGPYEGRPTQPVRSFDETSRVLSPDEVNKGWENAPRSASSIFSVDETLDVRDANSGVNPANTYEYERSRLSNPTARIDTTKLSQQEPARRVLTEPPTGYRAPAQDPTGGVVTEEQAAEAKPWWKRIF